jgi:Zn-dependent metalloprotease
MTYGDGSELILIFSQLMLLDTKLDMLFVKKKQTAYQKESGAMNEAFSDIWGACIEYYSTWKIYLVNGRHRKTSRKSSIYVR